MGKVREGAPNVAWRGECLRSAIRQAGNLIGELPCERTILGGYYAGSRTFVGCRGRWPGKHGRSDPHRDQEERNRGEHQDCASPHGPASYIQATD
jgi:hypothetical protein